MTTHYINSIPEFIDEILSGDFKDKFTIIGKYEDCKIVIKEILKKTDIMPACIDISDMVFDLYDDEYIVSVFDGELWCEKAKRNDYYLTVEDDIIYLIGEVSKDLVNGFFGGQVYIYVKYKSEEQEDKAIVDGKSNSIYISKNDNGEPDGFTKSWFTTKDNVSCHYSFSFYSDDKEELDRMAKLFEIKL